MSTVKRAGGKGTRRDAEQRKKASAAMARYRASNVPVSCVVHTKAQADTLKSIAERMRAEAGFAEAVAGFLVAFVDVSGDAAKDADCEDGGKERLARQAEDDCRRALLECGNF